MQNYVATTPPQCVYCSPTYTPTPITVRNTVPTRMMQDTTVHRALATVARLPRVVAHTHITCGDGLSAVSMQEGLQGMWELFQSIVDASLKFWRTLTSDSVHLHFNVLNSCNTLKSSHAE